MFSKEANEFSKLIEYGFIAGFSDMQYSSITEKSVSGLQPELLYVFPADKKDSFIEDILDYVFPTGIKISFIEEPPRLYSFALTNERGLHSYIYVWFIYENKNNIYLPIAICLNSYINDLDSFRDILNEAYLIISANDTEFSDKKADWINFFAFTNSILRPPNHTWLSLNYKYSNVDIYFSSICEIPTTINDSNIKLLFSVLEVTTISQWFWSMLNEKKIIIIANQPLLLYSICNALIKLIFPFKWLHTYIPFLPESQIDILEAPIPYMIGVLSIYVEYDKLIKLLPNNIIVDVDTCRISQVENHVDNHVEINLRKKIQLVKNPEIFEIDQIWKKSNDKSIRIEDINPAVSFSTNIQQIFFRPMRNALEKYRNYIRLKKNGNKEKLEFREKKFWKENFGNYNEEKYINLWTRIINTNAFSEFISEYNYKLEDTYTTRFNNIVDNVDDDSNISNSFHFEMTIKEDITRLLGKVGILIKKPVEENRLNDSVSDIADTPEIDKSKLMNLNIMNNGTNWSNTKQGKQNYTLIRKDEEWSLTPLVASLKTSIKYFGRFGLNDINNNNNHNLYNKKSNNGMTPLVFLRKTMYNKDNNNMSLGNDPEENNITNFYFYGQNGFIELLNEIMKTNSNDINILYLEEICTEILGITKSIADDQEKQNLMINNTNTEEYNNINEKKSEGCWSGCNNKNTIIQSKLTFGSEKENNIKTVSALSVLQKNYVKTINQQFNNWSLNKINEDRENKVFSFDQNMNKTFYINIIFAYYLSKYGEIQRLKNNDVSDCSTGEESEIKEKINKYYINAYNIGSNEFPFYRYYCFWLNNHEFISTQTVFKQSDIINEDTDWGFDKKGRKANSVIQHTANPMTISTHSQLDEPCIHTKKTIDIAENRLAFPVEYQTNTDDNKNKTPKNNSNNPQLNFKNYSINFLKHVSKDIKLDIINQHHHKKTIPNKPSIPNSELKKVIINKNYTNEPNKKSNEKSYFVWISELFDWFNTFKETSDIELLPYINELLASYKKINLSKLQNNEEKWFFWWNSFNILTLFSWYYTRSHPTSSTEWKEYLSNCFYIIGGYELSWIDILHNILGSDFWKDIRNSVSSDSSSRNKSISGSEYFSSLLAKFSVCKEYKLLIKFGIYLPNLIGKDLLFFNYDGIHRELKEREKSFLDNNITYDELSKILYISEELTTLDMNFVLESYTDYKDVWNESVFQALVKKTFKEIMIHSD